MGSDFLHVYDQSVIEFPGMNKKETKWMIKKNQNPIHRWACNS
jgi:hypothetical protein